jgi:hypothetical protein
MTLRAVALLIVAAFLGLGASAQMGTSSPPCCAKHGVCQTSTSPSTATVPSTTSAPTTTTVPAQTYLFDDEFNGTGPLDASKWWATPWCSTSTDDSFGCYNAANAFLNGLGDLVLRVSAGTMGRTYDFARVQTFREGNWPPPQVLWSHGPPIRIEARIKFAPGAGVWEGLWPMGVNSSTPLETDVQEFRGAVPSQDTCHVHGPVEGGSTIDTAVDLSAGWHLYWMNYAPSSVTFGVDGLTCGQFATPAQQLGIRLSNAVGPVGSWGGLGGPPPASALPADMLVDYVRVS